MKCLDLWMGFPHSSDGERIHPQCRRPQFDSWVGKICWRRDRLPSPVFLGFPCGSAGKESACNAGDLGLIPGLGRFPWRRERLPTPMFWPGEFHGLYSLCGRKELDTTEQLWHFLLRSKHLFMAAVTICSDSGAQKNKVCHCVAQLVKNQPAMRET